MDRRTFLRYLGVSLGTAVVSGLAPRTLFSQAFLSETAWKNGAKATSLWLLATGRAHCLDSDVYEFARRAIIATLD